MVTPSHTAAMRAEGEKMAAPLPRNPVSPSPTPERSRSEAAATAQITLLRPEKITDHADPPKRRLMASTGVPIIPIVLSR